MIRNVEEIVCAWDKGALIQTGGKGDDEKIIQPASFVYATRAGVAWIELPDDGLIVTPHKIQIREGKVSHFGDGLMVESHSDRTYLFPFDSKDPGMVPHGHAIQTFFNDLKLRSVDWQEERDKARLLVAKAIRDLKPRSPKLITEAAHL